MPAATQIKKGEAILLNGELYKILNLQHITPGKGNAVVQSDLRNVRTGVKTEKRFRSNEDVEVADLIMRKLQFLYETEGVYHFMDVQTFEQYEVGPDVVSDSKDFLVPETVYEVDLYESNPVGIKLPAKMNFKIIETDPAERGEAGKTKPAKLETGLVIQVPLFISSGELVVVNPEKKEYVERAE